MTNKKNGTLYVWVTSNIYRRAREHKNSTNKWFTQKYQLYLLVYFEKRTRITTAIQREKQIKACSRKSKIKLINELNSDRDDLSEQWYECME
jgi:putative endonuclease